MLSRLREPTAPWYRKVLFGDPGVTQWWGIPFRPRVVQRLRNEIEMHSWVEHVRAARRYGMVLAPEKYLEVRYEDLCRQPVATTERLLGFCQLELTESVRRFVSDSATTARIGKWKERPYEQLRPAIAIGRNLLDELGYLDADPLPDSSQTWPCVTTPRGDPPAPTPAWRLALHRLRVRFLGGQKVERPGRSTKCSDVDGIT